MKQADNLKMEDNLYEFRKCIFIKLIKSGYKYIARDKEGTIYAFSFKPTKHGSVWYFNITSEDGGKIEDISLVSCIFNDIEWEDVEPFKIPYVELDDKSKRFYGVRKE